MLLNLWATWCVPCRKEMPALDALQQKLGGPDFEVVAVNIDTRDPDKPKAWLKEVGIERLGYYADSSAKMFQDLKAVGRAFGMPTTILIDRNGCELGTLAGPAEWASDDAIKLIEAALGSQATVSDSRVRGLVDAAACDALLRRVDQASWRLSICLVSFRPALALAAVSRTRFSGRFRSDGSRDLRNLDYAGHWTSPH